MLANDDFAKALDELIDLVQKISDSKAQIEADRDRLISEVVD